MAITVTSKGTAANAKNANNLQVNCTFSAGDTVIVCVASDTGVDLASGGVRLRDSLATTYRTKGADLTGSNAGNVVINLVYFLNLTADEAANITRAIVYCSGAQAIVASVYGVSGLDTSAGIDKSSTGTGTSGTPSSGATATLTQADELVIGIAGMEDNVEDIAGSWTTGASNVSGNEQQAGTTGGGGASNIVIRTAAEVVSATAALTGVASADWAALVATFKGGSTGVTVNLNAATLTATPQATSITAGAV